MMSTNCQAMTQEQLLHFIDVVSFTVYDLLLYLDTHPYDEEAMSYFNQYMDMRRGAMRVYADSFGPLTVDLANPDRKWTWGDQPLPWEGGNC